MKFLSVKIFSEVNTLNIECLRFLKAYSLLCQCINFKNNEFPPTTTLISVKLQLTFTWNAKFGGTNMTFSV